MGAALFRSIFFLGLILFCASHAAAQNVSIAVSRLNTAKRDLEEADKRQARLSKTMMELGLGCTKSFKTVAAAHETYLERFMHINRLSKELIQAAIDKIQEPVSKDNLQKVDGGKGAFETMEAFYFLKMKDLERLQAKVREKHREMRALREAARKGVVDDMRDAKGHYGMTCLVFPKSRYDEAADSATRAFQVFPDADPANYPYKDKNSGFALATTGLFYADKAIDEALDEYAASRAELLQRIKSMK